MRRASWALLTLAAFACAPPAGESALGLAAARIQLGEDGHAQLLHGGSEETPVPATLAFRGEEMRGRLSLSGYGTRDHLKKSYRFDLAVDAGAVATGGIRSMKFSAQAQDSSFLRSLLGRKIYEALGLPTPSLEPVWVSIDGDGDGLYLMIERIDADFYRRRNIRPARLYKSEGWRARFDEDMALDPSGCFEAKIGAFHAADLRELARWAMAPVDARGLALIRSAVDVPAVARFLAANLFLANWDGFSNNLYLVQVEGAPLFRFTPWDWERAYDRFEPAASLVTYNRFFQRFADYPELRDELRFHLRFLAERFPPRAMREALDEEEARIREAYAADRWLGGLGRDLATEKRKLLEVIDRCAADISSMLR